MSKPRRARDAIKNDLPNARVTKSAAAQMSRPKGLAVVLGAYTVLCFMLFAFALFVAPMSVTMFDAPGSTTSPLTLALAFGILIAPALLIASPLAGWAAFAARRYRASRWAMVVLLLWLAYMGTVILLLSTLCGGRFAC